MTISESLEAMRSSVRSLRAIECKVDLLFWLSSGENPAQSCCIAVSKANVLAGICLACRELAFGRGQGTKYLLGFLYNLGGSRTKEVSLEENPQQKGICFAVLILVSVLIQMQDAAE